MKVHLSNAETKEILQSIERFFSQELEVEIGDLQSGFVLDFFLKEIAPFAYNQGVEDARRFFTEKLEDLPGACFEHGLTYWHQKKGGNPRLPSHD
ncbi:DUF2164 domain-containing protein [Luteolibacter luteus]|uniref:DUF2164 domain-containing protein n=1 Tax=Luteolibacter luteus TaxID=2728835 RepID=A0A858RQ30_9BACT|nr:DUF2164 domain-containing protein [Luteolibacter luteus]QJE98731.1 DUF2164 domain-containing protein [Luteolibacter luteus]